MNKGKVITILQILCFVVVLFLIPAMFFSDLPEVSGDTKYLVNILQAIRVYGLGILMFLSIICLQLFKK